ncbi:MAG: VWA domain-containing protein [Alphaproteobacteria bacterium]|nr:VWA domain-containing protein [Alphaproteobacteria bacterium]
MQRWHLTAGLAGSVALAALIVPQLQATVQTPPPSPLVKNTPEDPVAPPEARVLGKLELTAGLDHPVVLAGRIEERLLVMTVRAADSNLGEERPVNVSVVMDRSGSMAGRGKMDYARIAAKELVEALDARDRFSFVTFSDRAELVVPSSPVLDPGALFRAIDRVYEGGGTNLYDGLTEGLAQVRAHADDASVNRVVVLSDGNANVGISDPGELARLAGRWSDQGVSVSTIGLGLDYNEDLLAAMSDRGGGTYRFVDDPDTLAMIFQDELHQMTSVAASGVSLEINLPGAQLVEVYGYDVEPSTSGFRVWLGDVYAGQTRKVVAKVRVPSGTAGLEPMVAQVALDELGAPVDYIPVPVLAKVTADVHEVDRVVNRELAVIGTSAQSSALADKAARAYAEGRQKDSIQLIQASQLVAGEAASRYNDPSLQTQADDIAIQQESYINFDNSSVEGRRAVKENKEKARDWSR